MITDRSCKGGTDHEQAFFIDASVLNQQVLENPTRIEYICIIIKSIIINYSIRNILLDIQWVRTVFCSNTRV